MTKDKIDFVPKMWASYLSVYQSIIGKKN